MSVTSSVVGRCCPDFTGIPSTMKEFSIVWFLMCIFCILVFFGPLIDWFILIAWGSGKSQNSFDFDIRVQAPPTKMNDHFEWFETLRIRKWLIFDHFRDHFEKLRFFSTARSFWMIILKNHFFPIAPSARSYWTIKTLYFFFSINLWLVSQYGNHTPRPTLRCR